MVRVLQRPEKYLHIFNSVQKYFRWIFPRKIIFRITYFDCEMCEPPVELQVSVLPLLTILLSCSNRDSSKRDLVGLTIADSLFSYRVICSN